MPLNPNRSRGAARKQAARTNTPAPQPTHVKTVGPRPIPIADPPEDQPARVLPVPPSPEALNLAHAKKMDKNLRAGGRYPYTPNPHFRNSLSNSTFIEDNLARFLAS